jgi:hypothetical protein
MNCDKVKEKLSEYIDGELNQADTAFIRHHMAICSVCNQEERLLRSASRLLRNWENIKAPDGFCEALLAKAENVSRQSRRTIIDAVRPITGPGTLFRTVVYGAAVMLLFVGIMFFTKSFLREVPMVEPPPTYANPESQMFADNPKKLSYNIADQTVDNSPTFTTMAEMKIAGVWK